MFFAPHGAQPWLLLAALLRCKGTWKGGHKLFSELQWNAEHLTLMEGRGSCSDQNFYCLLHGQFLYSAFWSLFFVSVFLFGLCGAAPLCCFFDSVAVPLVGVIKGKSL
jgi:hypothetical protein